MITIKGDLILKKDMVFNESIKVEGDIKGDYNLVVKGDINAMDINAWDINAMDINAIDINAWNINAWDINAIDINTRDINAMDINAWDINAMDINAIDINAWDINAMDIICEKRIKKIKTAKTICRVFIKDKSKIEKKERG